MRAGFEFRGRRAWFVVTALGLLLAMVVAVVFSTSASTRRIANHASQLHFADQTLRVATAARAQTGMATNLALIERDHSVSFAQARQQAIDEARQAVDAIRNGADSIGADPLVMDSAGVLGQELAHEFDEVLNLLEAGRISQVQALIVNQLDPGYQAFVELVSLERDAQFEAVNDSEQSSSRIADVALFLLALIIPIAIVFIYWEVVRRQQRQTELEVRLDAERQLSRARDDFVANASHELRTPLTSIYGLAQLLEEDPTLTDMGRDMIGLIITETGDLNRMVEDLLTTARLAAGQLRFEPEEVNVIDEIEVMVGTFERNGADISIDVQPATVTADQLRQRQVIRNLLSNATKYGGPQLRLTGRIENHNYLWRVSDNGDGVPEELQDRLFQRFIHQLSFQQAVAGGVGLGLSIVKSLAEGMGGSVGYVREGGWTNFEVRIPLAQAETGAGGGRRPEASHEAPRAGAA